MPWIDFLVWILIMKLAPHYYWKLDHALDNHGQYHELSSWRKAFKWDWKKAAKTPISEFVDDKYKPDPWRWVCSCPYFVKSQFLICKHLVQLVQPVSPHFFFQVQWNCTTPFWSHEALIPIIPNPQPVQPPIETDQLALENLQPLPTDSQGGEQSGSDDDDDNLVDTGTKGTFQEQMNEHLKTLWEFCDILEYQTQFNDHQMLATLEHNGAGLLWLARNYINVERCSNSSQSSTPTTFEHSIHNTTFFHVHPKPSDQDTWSNQ